MWKKSENQATVAIIIVNYNSWKHTVECLESLHNIIYPRYITIVVDNASQDNSVQKIKSWVEHKIPINYSCLPHISTNKPMYLAQYEQEIAEDGGIPAQEAVLQKLSSNSKIVLIRNRENLGFSGGNNSGIRYALKNKADAVLILNPDVRIESPNTLTNMIDTLFSRHDIFVVGPNVLDAEGKRQTPLREPSFIEECFTPFVSAILKRVIGKAIDYLEPVRFHFPYEVRKIAGCFMLIRMSFLKEAGLLDENAFLYCEEPILAAQVNNLGGKIFFFPEAKVTHLHKNRGQGLYKEFITSRSYYLQKYKKYSKLKVTIIKYSYSLFNCLRSKTDTNKIQ